MKTKQEILNYCESNNTSNIKKLVPMWIEEYNENNKNKLHFAFHEDSHDTWKHGWSESEYYPEIEEGKEINKLFETTWLIGKKKPAPAFTKAQTYTAECAIFVFEVASINVDRLIERKTKFWEADYKHAFELKEKIEKQKKVWEETPKEIKDKVNLLHAELKRIKGTYNSKQRRDEIEAELKELPRIPDTLYDWVQIAVSYASVGDFIEYKRNKTIDRLTK